MTLGQKITNLRKARGMTQEELSESIGVTRQTISKWELDTSTPDLDYLCKLCDLFGVTADYLIRPERDKAEAAPPTHSEAISPRTVFFLKKRPSAPKLAGLILLGVCVILTQVIFACWLFGHEILLLLCLTAALLALGLELVFIRRAPLFIAMWTGWGLYTFFVTVGTASLPRLIITIIYGVAADITWGYILSALWILYTAFCIGMTVGVICKSVRAKRAGR